MPRIRSFLAPAAIAALLLSGCAATAPESGAGFPVGASPDYQLGGAYEPDAAVGVVGRDREAEPADGVYSVCYVNGFQTQPGELDLWPEELLLQRDGATVFDPEWPDEALLDTGSAEAREAISGIVGPWIEGCAERGFDAVEFDNLDTFSRSDGALAVDDNVALAAALVAVAHDAGLAAGQKNAAELTERMHEEAGFDFAVVEECAVYDECGAYTDVYGDAVIDIEYTDALPRPFAEVCADPATPASVVLRDRDLLTPDDEGHVFELCP